MRMEDESNCGIFHCWVTVGLLCWGKDRDRAEARTMGLPVREDPWARGFAAFSASSPRWWWQEITG